METINQEGGGHQEGAGGRKLSFIKGKKSLLSFFKRKKLLDTTFVSDLINSVFGGNARIFFSFPKYLAFFLSPLFLGQICSRKKGDLGLGDKKEKGEGVGWNWGGGGKGGLRKG